MRLQMRLQTRTRAKHKQTLRRAATKHPAYDLYTYASCKGISSVVRVAQRWIIAVRSIKNQELRKLLHGDRCESHRL